MRINNRPRRPAALQRRVLALGAGLAAMLVLLTLLLAGPGGSFRRTDRVVASFLSNYDERKVYRLERRLLNGFGSVRDPARKDRLRLFLGRLQFAKALHNDARLREIYLDAGIRYFGAARLSTDTAIEAEALFWLGLSFYQKGEFQYPAAINHLIAALRGGYPDRLKILKILNYIYLKNRDFDVIIGIDREFLKSGYWDGDIVYGLGKALRELRRYREAEEVLGHFDRLDPVRDRHIIRYILFELAETRFALAEYGPAAEAYERCLRTAADPENDDLTGPARERLAVCRQSGARDTTKENGP